jgi:hypothetical protein
MQDSETTEKSQDTGHKLELGNATTALVDAFARGDAALIRKAAADHATALNSQATAMAASIAAPLYTQLEEIKKLIGAQARNTKAIEDDIQGRATYFYKHFDAFLKDADARFTGYDQSIATAVEAVAVAGKALALAGDAMAGVEALAGAVSDQGERIDTIDSRLILVEQNPATSPALLEGMESLKLAIADTARQQLYHQVAIAALVILLTVTLIVLAMRGS